MTQVDYAAWNDLAGDAYPFLRHEFLLALEQSASISEQTGWNPAHLLVLNNHQLVAFMPLYLKQHSWGEYVFDQQWAQAYQLGELVYYPKWSTAIPLTPCQGTRIVIKEGSETLVIRQMMLDFICPSVSKKYISDD